MPDKTGTQVIVSLSRLNRIREIDLASNTATVEAGPPLRPKIFGWALGLAFQLNDDLLGIWGAEQATGKAPSDVVHKKKTLPVIYAFEHAEREADRHLAR